MASGRSLSAFGRDRRGATAVEFASLFAVFIAFVYAAFELTIYFLSYTYLDGIAEKSARQVMTGHITTSAELQSYICANIKGLIDCGDITTDLHVYSSFVGTSLGPATRSQYDFGAPNAIMTLQLTYPFKTLGLPYFNFGDAPNGSKLMVSSYVFVRE